MSYRGIDAMRILRKLSLPDCPASFGACPLGLSAAMTSPELLRAYSDR